MLYKQKALALVSTTPTHGFLFLYTMSKQVENVDTMPVVEALYRKIQPLPIGKDQLLEYLSEQVAKEFFKDIIKAAHGECVVRCLQRGRLVEEWRISALCQEGKGKTFAKAVLSLHGAIANAKAKEGGVL